MSKKLNTMVAIKTGIHMNQFEFKTTGIFPDVLCQFYECESTHVRTISTIAINSKLVELQILVTHLLFMLRSWSDMDRDARVQGACGACGACSSPQIPRPVAADHRG